MACSSLIRQVFPVLFWRQDWTMAIAKPTEMEASPQEITTLADPTLLDKIDKLRDLNVSDYIPLPQVVQSYYPETSLHLTWYSLSLLGTNQGRLQARWTEYRIKLLIKLTG